MVTMDEDLTPEPLKSSNASTVASSISFFITSKLPLQQSHQRKAILSFVQPSRMNSLFQRSSTVSYAVVAPCMLEAMFQFNQATQKAPLQADTCECSICHDTMGPNLAITVLPDCKHRFHELCIQTWLSPIQLPDTTRGPVTFWTNLVDSIFREIEDRCHFWEDLARLTSARREPVARLSSGTEIDSDVEESLQAAYDQDEEMTDEPEVRAPDADSGVSMPPDVVDVLVPEGEGVELEEGEIREAQPPQASQDSQHEDLEEGEIRDARQFHQTFRNLIEQVMAAGVLPQRVQQQHQRRSQDLPDISEDYIYDISPFKSRESSHSCPYCRRSAFFEGLIECHADTLQLIRVRLRLTDLAYRCLDFDRTDKELQERAIMIDFLNRRHADNVTLGEREIPLRPSSCKRVFRQARSILRREAYTYSIGHGLQHGSEEHSRVMRFATFFEHFRLRDGDIPFFFDANPAFNDFVWGNGFRLMRYQKRLLECLLERDDPRFFRMLRLGLAITPHSYVTPLCCSEFDDDSSDTSMSDD